jgi:hypothetical protein
MTALVLFGLAMTGAGPALAQPRRSQPKRAEPSVRHDATTRYDFDDDTVEGDLMRPTDSFVAARRGAKHQSLIRIRRDFVPELVDSADAL